MADIDWDLLFRYLGNECDDDERARFEVWLRGDPTHRAFLDAAAMAAARVLERGVVSSPLPRVDVRPPTSTPRWSYWALAAAASVLIVVGGTLVWRAFAAAGADAMRSATDHRVVTTARGERATVVLTDGTHVVLGPATTLRYPGALGRRSRDVLLTGEAYFVVAIDVRRPFRVHAGDAVAEALGTAFAVRAYPEDSVVRVVVAEGAVALGAGIGGAAAGAVLRRGQLGRLAKGHSMPTSESVDIEALLGWLEGRVVFDEDPLPEVLAHLGRWYEASFRLGDTSLASSRLTASFTNESLDEVLLLLAPALDVDFERQGDTVVVLPRRQRR